MRSTKPANLRTRCAQVRPADLALIHGPEAEDFRSIADENAACPLQQTRNRCGGAVAGDHEDGDQGGADRPERPIGSASGPRGRVHVLDGLGAREVNRLLDRRRNGLAHTLLGFAESSERNAYPEYVAQQHHRLTTAHAAAPRQKSDQRQEPGAEHGSRNARRQRGSRAMAAFLAVCRVHPVLGHVRLDLRKVDHLMADRIRIFDTRQRRPAMLAFARMVVLDLRDLLGRQHLSPLRLVPGLPATFAPARRRLFAISTLLRRVLRRRLVGVRRVLTEPRFQICDARHQLRDQCLQLGDTLDITRISRHPSPVPKIPANGKWISQLPRSSISHSRQWTYRPGSLLEKA